MGMVDAVRESELAGLEAMRDKLAADMEIAEPAVVAQIAGRLDAVLARIESARKAQPTEGSGFDELKQRRASRGQSDSQRRASPRRNRDKRSG